SAMCCDNRLNRSCVADTHSAFNPLDRRDEEVTRGRKGLFFSADTPRIRLRQTPNFQFWVLPLAYPMERTQNQNRSLGNTLSILISYAAARGALFIVRSRNSCINDPIRSTSSSNAKWPVSRRWSSALGISLLKSSAPSTVKIPSFLPQVISVGGCSLRKYSRQSAKTSRSLFA